MWIMIQGIGQVLSTGTTLGAASAQEQLNFVEKAATGQGMRRWTTPKFVSAHLFAINKKQYAAPALRPAQRAGLNDYEILCTSEMLKRV